MEAGTERKRYMDKLLSQREVELTNLLAHAMDENGALRDQLADTMRENERLREGVYKMLMRFYYDNGNLPEIKLARELLKDYPYKDSK